MPEVTNYQLTGGNSATNRLVNYYNQFRTQLMANPNTITAPVIEAPQQMQAQQIAAPDKIQANLLETENRTYGDYADEAASYLQKYLDNSIAARRRQTGEARAAADVDALSRGMGASTWLSDAKNRMAMQEAADIMAAQNEFLGRVGEQAFAAMEAQRNRNLQANLANQSAQLTADQQNAAYQNRVAEYNANALMNADQFNIGNALDVAVRNAQNQLAVDEFNAQLYQTLEQLAYNYAGQMYGLNPVKSGGRGGKATTSGGLWDAVSGSAGTLGNVLSGAQTQQAAQQNAALNQVAQAIVAATNNINGKVATTPQSPIPGGKPLMSVKE